jgi:hypothetical protein
MIPYMLFIGTFYGGFKIKRDDEKPAHRQKKENDRLCPVVGEQEIKRREEKKQAQYKSDFVLSVFLSIRRIVIPGQKI